MMLNVADRPRSGTKDEKFIGLLSKIAEAVPPVRSSKIAAAIVLKGEIISFGVNQMKTHPFQSKYAKNTEAVYLHAENAAILSAMKKIDKEDFKKATLYVARVKRENSHKKGYISGLACPCEGCQKAIDDFGIKRVVYTKDNGGINSLF